MLKAMFRKPTPPLTLAILTGFFLSLCAKAEVIFQADFDGAGSIVSVGGKGGLRSRDDATASINNTDPLGGSGGPNLMLSREANVDASSFIGVFFEPILPETWINAWYKNDGANDTLVGALDFFYRQNSDFNGKESFEIQFLEEEEKNGLDLRLKNSDVPGQLRLTLKNETADKLLVDKSVPFEFKENTLYHIAIVADGAAGATSLRVYIKEGNVEIDPMADTPLIREDGITLDTDGRLEKSFVTTGVDLRIGTRMDNWQAFDGELDIRFDQFRIFDAVPERFSGL